MNLTKKLMIMCAASAALVGCSVPNLYSRTFRGMYEPGRIYTVNDRNNDGKLDEISVITHAKAGPNGYLRKVGMLDSNLDGKWDVLKEDVTFNDSQGKEKRRDIATLIDLDKDGNYEKGEIKHRTPGKTKKFKLYPLAHGIVEDPEDTSKFMYVKFGAIDSFIQTCKSLAERAAELTGFHKR